MDIKRGVEYSLDDIENAHQVFYRKSSIKSIDKSTDGRKSSLPNI